MVSTNQIFQKLYIGLSNQLDGSGFAVEIRFLVRTALKRFRVRGSIIYKLKLNFVAVLLALG